jgi:hypothetical protein
MTSRKVLRRGCEVYLACVMDSKKENVELPNLPIVREFLNIFPEELLGVPRKKKVEVFIDILYDTSLIGQSPYRIVFAELDELKI